MKRLVGILAVTLTALVVAVTVVGAANATVSADLGITVGISNSTPNVGDTITFTITLTNHGPASTASSVTVFDRLPAGLHFVSATPSQGSYNNTTAVWDVGSVTTGTPQTLLLQAVVASPATETNTAKVTHSSVPDPVASNNVASSIVHPQHADLALTQTVNSATPNVGDTVTFTVTLKNRGPQAATNVVVYDPLPAGLSFVSALLSQGIYIAGTWTVGTVGPLATATITIHAQVVSPSAQTNTVTVSHSDQYDPVTTNNKASTTVHPQNADLRVMQVASKTAVNVGDPVTLTVTVTDLGPSTATNVDVFDLLPAGLSFVSATPTRGTYSSGTGIWAIGTIAPATSAVLRFQATLISASTMTNTAVTSHADQFDPNTVNNSASATVRPLTSELVLSQFTSTFSPAVNDPFLLTLTLTNAGPDTATHVAVSDFLPPGMTLVSATASRGTYSSGAWNVGTLAAGSAATLALHVKAVIPATYVNTASILHSDEFDPNTIDNSSTTIVTAS